MLLRTFADYVDTPHKGEACKGAEFVLAHMKKTDQGTALFYMQRVYTEMISLNGETIELTVSKLCSTLSHNLETFPYTIYPHEHIIYKNLLKHPCLRFSLLSRIQNLSVAWTQI
jgi:hypothetical protein